MHRIDTPTAQVDKFGLGKNGFTRGNPQTGTPATELDDDYFDMLQEEMATVVESTGVALDKAKHNQLLIALKNLLLSRSNPFADIKADGNAAIATALANLGLGTAATKTVGTGAGQIPDMSSFTSSLASGHWWQRMPGGLIIQGGFSPTSNPPSVQDVNISFPIAFPNRMLWIGEHDQAQQLGITGVWGFVVGAGAVTTGLTASQIGTFNRGVGTMALPQAASCSYLAIGY